MIYWGLWAVLRGSCDAGDLYRPAFAELPPGYSQQQWQFTLGHVEVTHVSKQSSCHCCWSCPRPALSRLQWWQDLKTARFNKSKIHSKVKRLVKRLIRIEISIRNTRFCVRLHTDILLEFSKLFYDILNCFDFISAYFDLILFEKSVRVDILIKNWSEILDTDQDYTLIFCLNFLSCFVISWTVLILFLLILT